MKSFFRYHLPGTLKAFVFFIFLLSAAYSYAAVTTVVGSVRERDGGRAVEFANVSAVDSTGRIAAICATDESGDFILHVRKEGRYRINVTFVGYATWEKEVVCAGEGIDLGRIRLKRSSEELAGAGITAKTLIRKEADRITYDVLEDPDAGRLNMAAFMSKIPGLEESPSDGKLQYKDGRVAKILIDNKDNPIINGQRQYPMTFIRADYMSKIELILPGSPEYNNEEPILLITLDRELPLGIASEIHASAQTTNSYSVSPDVVANVPFIGIGVNYKYSYAHEPSIYTRTERTVFDADGSGSSGGDGYVDSSNESRSKSSSHNINVNLFRSAFKDKLDFVFSMSTSYSDVERKSDAYSLQQNPGEESVERRTSALSDIKSPFRFNAGLDVNYSWGKSNLVQLRYTFSNNYSVENEYMYDGMSDPSESMNVSTSSSKEHNIGLMLRLASQKKPGLWGITVTGGYMFRDYDDSDIYGYSAVGTHGSIGGMDYMQGVGYLSGSFSGRVFDRKVMYSISFNAENVTNRGTDVGTGASLDYDEFNFIPRAHLNWRITRGIRFGASYSCKTARPRQSMLDPYEDDSDPHNITVGNPDLKGEISHNVDADIEFELPLKWFPEISLGGTCSLTGNAIERISYISDATDNVTTTTYMNIGERKKYSASLNMRFKPAKKVNISLRANCANEIFNISDTQVNSFWSFSLTEMCVARFRYFTLLQMFRLYPSAVDAQTRAFRLNPSLGFEISRYWDKIHLGTSIGVTDLLHGRSSTPSVKAGDGFVQTTYSQRLGRYVHFSIFWRIGKFKNSPSVKHESYDMD